MKLQIAFGCVMTCGLMISTVDAFPPMPGYLKDGYKDEASYKSFLETVEALKTKCDVCHIPGADKRRRDMV